MMFRYKSIKRPNGPPIKSPSIPVTIIGPKESLELIALVDSGADISVIPKEVAEVLGLDLSGEIQPALGVGGSIKTVPSHVSLVVERGHERYRLNIPIKVALDQQDIPPILGRTGFFEEFEITFNELEEKIYLKKIDRSPNLRAR